MTPTRLATLSALVLLAIPGLGRAADGAKIYALQCKTCHQPKSTLMGPSLIGVAGGKIARLADFKYSPALLAKAGTWSDAELDSFLAAPARYAPGNRMPASLSSAADRVAVIAYMKSLK
jgi:cytochrome c